MKDIYNIRNIDTNIKNKDFKTFKNKNISNEDKDDEN